MTSSHHFVFCKELPSQLGVLSGINFLLSSRLCPTRFSFWQILHTFNETWLYGHCLCLSSQLRSARLSSQNPRDSTKHSPKEFHCRSLHNHKLPLHLAAITPQCPGNDGGHVKNPCRFKCCNGTKMLEHWSACLAFEIDSNLNIKNE
eukprot:Gb_32524 [translate_table: standard]